MTKNQKGFTLIELLIVIVIIGILAGVLIAVINPASQQTRARDAGVQASINKVALAVEGFNSAYGRAPWGNEVIGSLQNAQDCGTVGASPACGNIVQCNPSPDGDCVFNITGNTLRADAAAACDANWWRNNGNNQCFYRYYREAAAGDTTHFRIYAKSFGIANTVFLYDNKTARISECNATTVADTNTAGALDADPCL